MLLCAGLIAGGLADAALAAMSPPFTWQADLASALGIAGVVALGSVRLLRKHRRRLPPPPPAPRLSRASAIGWIGIGLAALSFEVLNYFLSPRPEHPTASSMVAALTSHDVLRGLLFVAWLGAGYWIWDQQ